MLLWRVYSCFKGYSAEPSWRIRCVFDIQLNRVFRLCGNSEGHPVVRNKFSCCPFYKEYSGCGVMNSEINITNVANVWLVKQKDTS